ncbi:cyclopropane-fatty-acyl-phospholipid synthase family protein [Aerosakkonemataceae cyanobacterium BLCC-F154]|uniref:Cyclopropane-fatty-acyl-phospholipid synthase family protein n=1 Tax=Floridaenema fluviatile BLCC-F154 TaxID=3153640 RepID=A0ABV4YE14_9CYAN
MQLQPIKLLLIAGVSISGLLFAGCTQPAQKSDQAKAEVKQQTPNVIAQLAVPEKDVPFVPTPEIVVAEMLKQAKVDKNDVLYDLGSGDGRIVITAAQKFGARGVGIDIDPELVKKSQENAQKAGVADRVKFMQQDLFKTDLSEATVVTLYLLPDVNLKLRPKLLSELKPGTRVVSHNYDMGEWKPENVVKVKGPRYEHTVYSWVVPKEIPANLRPTPATTPTPQ